MKTIIKASALLMCLSLGCHNGEGKTMSGEHLNGMPYVEYAGPLSIDAAVQKRAFAALDKYVASKSPPSVQGLLDASKASAWTKIGPEYVEGNDANAKTLVGIRYRKGVIDFVFYQNLIVAMLVADKDGNRQTYHFFISETDNGPERELRVKDEVVM